jgi:hypothetical protein
VRATNADSTGRSSSPEGAPKGRGELRDQPPDGPHPAYDRAGHNAASEARRQIAAETQSHATSHTRPFSVKSYARVSDPWRAVRKPKDRWPPAATAAL